MARGEEPEAAPRGEVVCRLMVPLSRRIHLSSGECMSFGSTIRFQRLNAFTSAGNSANHSPSPRLSANRLCQYASTPPGSSVSILLNSRRWNRNLDRQLASSAANGVRAANLVMRPGFHEINEPSRNLSLPSHFRRRRRRSISLLDAESKDVFVSRSLRQCAASTASRVCFPPNL